MEQDCGCNWKTSGLSYNFGESEQISLVGSKMNAPEILQRIFRLKYTLDLASPEDCAYIQRQIDEQIGHLQCIAKEPTASLIRVINKRYPEWLDGKFPLPNEDGKPKLGEGS